MSGPDDLVELGRPLAPGFLVMIKRRGFRAVRQKGNFCGLGTRFLVDPVVWVLVDRVDGSLSFAEIECALVQLQFRPELQQVLLATELLQPRTEGWETSFKTGEMVVASWARLIPREDLWTLLEVGDRRAVARFCVYCGELRDASAGKCRGRRRRHPSPDRCAEDTATTEVRFHGDTGERLDPPPFPPPSLLRSIQGDLI